MNTELLLITLLIIKHFICDFPCQTMWMASNKGTYGHLGGIAHVGVHMLGTFCVFIIFSQITEIFFIPELFLGMIAIEAVIHYNTDWFKMFLNRKMNWYPESSSEFWYSLGIDQLIHYLTYVGMIWYLL